MAVARLAHKADLGRPRGLHPLVAGLLTLSLVLLLCWRADVKQSVTRGLDRFHHCLATAPPTSPTPGNNSGAAAGAGGNSSVAAADGSGNSSGNSSGAGSAAWLVSSNSASSARPPGFDPVPAGNSSADVAVCLPVLGDHCDIREWVLYHATIGVGKIYMFDTGSVPPMDEGFASPTGLPSLDEVLADVLGSGLVEYHYLTADAEALADRSATLTVVTDSSAGPIQLIIPPPVDEKHGRNWQMNVYSACLLHFGVRHRWMGFIDSDEFVLLQPGVPSLPALLDRYTSGGVRLQWWLFSSGPHLVRPSGGVLASYTACCQQDEVEQRWTKTFLQPARAVGPLSAHVFVYKEGWGVVDTSERVPVDTPEDPVNTHGNTKHGTYEGAVIAHYITRSFQDYERKVARSGGDGNSIRTLNLGFIWEEACRQRCLVAAPLGRALAARWDLTLNTPAWCRPGLDAARDMLARSGDDAFREWLRLLQPRD
ncbi:glycosyl transferase family 2 [Micractinium conductrix]|uniref:Glycosyl transferase family 2 n=1 Tax=Micractinium conductrix TaxID=554055 RepID=A0A2P6V7L6_9CHLO|nr:glycosyl transferase family 2 [Micractinium conductrix]|eukprot:PSC70070.1 glycosyl transferase family 2 [Micractinium conductrix]